MDLRILRQRLGRATDGRLPKSLESQATVVELPSQGRRCTDVVLRFRWSILGPSDDGRTYVAVEGGSHCCKRLDDRWPEWLVMISYHDYFGGRRLRQHRQGCPTYQWGQAGTAK